MNPVLPSRAGQLDLQIDQGADYDETFTWGAQSTGDPDTFVPYDQTDCHAELKAGTGAEVLHLTDGAGIDLGGPAGTVRLYLDDAQTAALAWDDPVPYWINVTFPNGAVRRFLEGFLLVLRDRVDA